MKRLAEAKMTHFFDAIPIRAHFRTDLHLLRKIWHLLMGVMIAFLYLYVITSRSTAVIVLASFLGLDLFMESLRLRSTFWNDKMMRFWGPVMRAHEVNQLSSVPHYIASVAIAIAVFPKPVAILAILFLACGDPIASAFGILYGHRGPRLAGGKTLIGTLAGVTVCALLTFFYLKTLSIGGSTLLAVTLMGGLAGGLVELLPFDIDDNFTIPIVSGFVLWLTFMVFGVC